MKISSDRYLNKGYPNPKVYDDLYVSRSLAKVHPMWPLSPVVWLRKTLRGHWAQLIGPTLALAPKRPHKEVSKLPQGVRM